MADNQHSINTYVSDMIALERHIAMPFGTQLHDDDFQKHGEVRTLLENLTKVTDRHIEALETLLQQLGGHEASSIKNAVSMMEGMVAGAIDKMRKTKVSKGLRDDYTALSLSTASYTMLNATANAMRNSEVAQLAQKHLQDYAQTIMQIAETLPGVVVLELQEIGLTVDPGTIQKSVEQSQSVWRQHSTAMGPN